MKAVFNNAKLQALVGVVPTNVARFADELERYPQGRDKALKLQKIMGYDQRRIAPAGVCASDLVEFGVRRLVELGLVDLATVDALILVTETPDYVLPPTSNVLHGRLELRDDVYCIDINQGCTGFIYGLLQACALLQSTSARRALVCVGDTLSHRTSVRDRNSYPLVGDAAAVALIERSESAAPIHLAICNRGSAHDALMIPAGGARRPSTAATREEREDEFGNFRSEEQLTMKGGDVFNFTQTVVPEFIESLLVDAGTAKDRIAWFFLHQANTFIVKKIAERLGVPFDKAPSDIVSKYGNSSPATIPLTIAEHFPSGLGPLPVCLCGFGVGLSWGGAVLELGPLAASKIIEYPGR